MYRKISLSLNEPDAEFLRTTVEAIASNNEANVLLKAWAERVLENLKEGYTLADQIESEKKSFAAVIMDPEIIKATQH